MIMWRSHFGYTAQLRIPDFRERPLPSASCSDGTVEPRSMPLRLRRTEKERGVYTTWWRIARRPCGECRVSARTGNDCASSGKQNDPPETRASAGYQRGQR